MWAFGLFWIGLAIGLTSPLDMLWGQQGIDLNGVAKLGIQSQKRLETSSASWRHVFETAGGGESIVEVKYSPSMKSFRFFVQEKEVVHDLAKIIVRDGFWYVEQNGVREKYRPYEAPLKLPFLLIQLERSLPVPFVDPTAVKGGAIQRSGNELILRPRVDPQLRTRLQATLRSIDQLERAGPLREEMKVLRAKAKERLEQGTELRIDSKSGFFVQGGPRGKRFWMRDFQWADRNTKEWFSIDGVDWKDETGPIVSEQDASHHLLMITHEPLWEPGQPIGDGNLVLINMMSAQTRRIPFPFGMAIQGTLSIDRSAAFVTGLDIESGSVRIGEIQLSSGQYRSLGGEELQEGISSFPSPSPDGKSLAVLHSGTSEKEGRIHVIDIATGVSKIVGPPMEIASISWLPDSDGFVFAKREINEQQGRELSRIYRMNLEGEMKWIGDGEEPLVIHATGQILFASPKGNDLPKESDGKERLWSLCDLEGKGTKPIGDGLPEFVTPTSSPDGRTLFMMKLDSDQTPRPYWIDIESGNATPLRFGKGHWRQPQWR